MFNKLKTCRCCLQQDEDKNGMYEFSSEVSVDNEIREDATFVKISECFTVITGITISEELEDSSKICSRCLGDLKFCYQFRRKCAESEYAYNGCNEIEPQEALVEAFDNQSAYQQNIIEYVEEEYIDEINDETTNDGYEIEEQGYESATISNSGAPSRKRQRTETLVQDDSYLCQLCPEAFEDKKSLLRHTNRKHNKQSYEESEELINKVYQCDLCSKISMTSEEAESHSQEHEGEACYKCKKCDKKFTSEEDAREHLNVSHKDSDKNFACEACPKSFRNRYQLNLHIRVHTGEKPFECSICKRCFSMSSNLQKHIDTHSTEKPYPCTICNLSFKTQRSLKFHTVCYHQPEDKVKCHLCDKGFVSKSYLKMHMLYHTGEKNFTCSICKSKYYKSSHLKRHIQNVHLKLRLMKCEFCTSDFVRKETYRAHLTSHHKRHLTEQEYQDTLEKVRLFQPPSLDVNKFILEKQTVVPEGSENDEKELEGIVEGVDEEGLLIEVREDDYYEELYDDEQ